MCISLTGTSVAIQSVRQQLKCAFTQSKGGLSIHTLCQKASLGVHVLKVGLQYTFSQSERSIGVTAVRGLEYVFIHSESDFRFYSFSRKRISLYVC